MSQALIVLIITIVMIVAFFSNVIPIAANHAVESGLRLYRWIILE